jgi:hypothetical protein
VFEIRTRQRFHFDQMRGPSPYKAKTRHNREFETEVLVVIPFFSDRKPEKVGEEASGDKEQAMHRSIVVFVKHKV